jgi:hypothetical protein
VVKQDRAAHDGSARVEGLKSHCWRRPAQRCSIATFCCSLGHLGGFALHRLVHIFAQLIDVRAQEAFGCLSIISAACC